MIKPISEARFEVLCFMRRPAAKLYGQEREWYADDDENIIGTLIFDLIDSDWGYVILGRNEVSVFCAIDTEVSLATAEKAREALHQAMVRISATGQRVFPQEAAKKKAKIFNLFNPIVQPEKQHAIFKILSDGSGYSPARELLAELAYTYEDPDGNYVQQFQSDGFDARLWEIYLYAVLHENDFSINRDFRAPDYVGMKYGIPLVLEATTVNPTQDENTDELEKLDPDGKDMADYMAIKFANALYAKLQKRYWELAHVKGKPLVLAVADFEKPKGIHYSAKFVQEYVYGVRQSREGERYINTKIIEHAYGTRRKPSGFFSLPGSENVSAVLFSDGGTISKFNRMGKIAGFGRPDVTMVRVGHRYETATSPQPTEFRDVVEPPAYTETWSEGIYLFHNAQAKYPINPALFREASHSVFINEKFEITVPDRFPIWSKTLIMSTAG